MACQFEGQDLPKKRRLKPENRLFHEVSMRAGSKRPREETRVSSLSSWEDNLRANQDRAKSGAQRASYEEGAPEIKRRPPGARASRFHQTADLRHPISSGGGAGADCGRFERRGDRARPRLGASGDGRNERAARPTETVSSRRPRAGGGFAAAMRGSRLPNGRADGNPFRRIFRPAIAPARRIVAPALAQTWASAVFRQAWQPAMPIR